MLSMSFTSASPLPERQPLVERVRDTVTSLQGTLRRPRTVWARGSGLHVLLGLYGEDAFARLTPLGGTSYGLAFRSAGAGPRASEGPGWEPLLLVDELEQVVEHALIAEGALPG